LINKNHTQWLFCRNGDRRAQTFPFHFLACDKISPSRHPTWIQIDRALLFSLIGSTEVRRFAPSRHSYPDAELLRYGD
jgi:hypothetical protein